MRQSTCSGSLSLLCSRCALLISFFNCSLKRVQASGEGRGRSRRALPLLFLYFFSSFSFASYASFSPVSSSPVGNYVCQVHSTGENYGGSPAYVFDSLSDACSSDGLLAYVTTNAQYWCVNLPYGDVILTCSLTSATSSSCPSGFSLNSSGVCAPSAPVAKCTPPAGMPVDPQSSDAFCDPSDDCESSSGGVTVCMSGICTAATVTNGKSCTPSSGSGTSTAPTASTSSTTTCSSGSSFVPGTNGCICQSSSGSFSSAINAGSDSACTGGSSPSQLTPVAPVVSSNGSPTCPPGSASSTSGSGSVSCYQISSSSNPSTGGSSSSFSSSPATKNANGTYSCPSGDSSIGSGSSMQCISSNGSGSGSSTSPTSSTGSSIAPTSSQSYPSSISLPSLPSFSSSTQSLGSIPSISETTSQTCPSPVTFTVYGTTFSIPFTYACDLAGDVRPVIIGVFSLVGLLLIVR